jgi:hypothetical protein
MFTFKERVHCSIAALSCTLRVSPQMERKKWLTERLAPCLAFRKFQVVCRPPILRNFVVLLRSSGQMLGQLSYTKPAIISSHTHTDARARAPATIHYIWFGAMRKCQNRVDLSRKKECVFLTLGFCLAAALMHLFLIALLLLLVYSTFFCNYA